MDRPAVSAIIEITLDPDNDTYKTKSYLEVAEEFSQESIELPRDVLLGMIYELQVMSRKIANKAEVSEKEMTEYLESRKLVSVETDEKETPKKQKDSIDNAIENLFKEDEDNADS